VGEIVQFLTGRPTVRRSKTHCRQGHRFTKANTFRNKRGWRSCRVCQRIKGRERRQRIREAQIRAGLWPKPPKPLSTHCKRGHLYTPDNTYLKSENGRQYRQCKTCTIAGVLARRARLRAQLKG
jgi:hypothetical protein